jgi:hypothetical protein
MLIFLCIAGCSGAGGMFRYSSLKGECIDFYIKTCSVDIYSDSVNDVKQNAMAGFSPLLTGSLMLAEDRVLTYGCVVKSQPSGSFTAYVADATFFVRDGNICQFPRSTEQNRITNTTPMFLVIILI